MGVVEALPVARVEAGGHQHGDPAGRHGGPPAGLRRGTTQQVGHRRPQPYRVLDAGPQVRHREEPGHRVGAVLPVRRPHLTGGGPVVVRVGRQQGEGAQHGGVHHAQRHEPLGDLSLGGGLRAPGRGAEEAGEAARVGVAQIAGLTLHHAPAQPSGPDRPPATGPHPVGLGEQLPQQSRELQVVGGRLAQEAAPSHALDPLTDPLGRQAGLRLRAQQHPGLLAHDPQEVPGEPVRRDAGVQHRVVERPPGRALPAVRGEQRLGLHGGEALHLLPGVDRVHVHGPGQHLSGVLGVQHQQGGAEGAAHQDRAAAVPPAQGAQQLGAAPLGGQPGHEPGQAGAGAEGSLEVTGEEVAEGEAEVLAPGGGGEGRLHGVRDRPRSAAAGLADPAHARTSPGTGLPCGGRWKGSSAETASPNTVALVMPDTSRGRWAGGERGALPLPVRRTGTPEDHPSIHPSG